MFRVSYDSKLNLIRSELSGFLSLDEVAAYAGEVEPIIRRAAQVSRGYLILIDVSGCAIQSKAVVAAFQAHVAGVPQAKRCAVVTGSSIIRMQIKRIIAGSQLKVFSDDRAALLWLRHGSEPQPGQG